MPDRPYRFKSDQTERPAVWSVNLGNVLTILTILVAVTIAYEKLEGRATNTEGQTAELKSAVSTLNNTLIDTNLAVRELRTVVQMEGRKTREQNEH